MTTEIDVALQALHGSTLVPLEVVDDADSPSGYSLPVIDGGTAAAIAALAAAIQHQTDTVLVHRVASIALSGHRLVVPLDNGELDYADNSTPGHVNRPVWLTTRSWSQNDLADVVASGAVYEPTWSWIPDQPVFLGDNGMLTQTAPTSSNAYFLRVVGSPVDATTLYFHPQPPMIL